MDGIFAPPGYDVCRAFINWSNASMSGSSTLNASILNAHDNGDKNGPYYLALYIVVQKGDGMGHSAKADIAVEIVPSGRRAEFGCWESKSAPGVSPWQCKGQNCTFHTDAQRTW